MCNETMEKDGLDSIEEGESTLEGYAHGALASELIAELPSEQDAARDDSINHNLVETEQEQGSQHDEHGDGFGTLTTQVKSGDEAPWNDLEVPFPALFEGLRLRLRKGPERRRILGLEIELRFDRSALETDVDPSAAEDDASEPEGQAPEVEADGLTTARPPSRVERNTNGWGGQTFDREPSSSEEFEAASAAAMALSPQASAAKPVVKLADVQPGKKNGSVLIVQKALAKAVGLDYASGPGTFGPATVAAYAKWQRACGYSGDAADGKPGAATLKKLGDRYGFLVSTAAPAPPKNLALSKKGAEFVALFEGVKLKLYNDPVGHCTIGIGHLVHQGKCNGREPAEFKKGISRARAFELLQKDAGQAASAVNGLRVPLNQQQFDALVSFTFNLGPGWTKKSGLREALLARRYGDVPNEMSKWVYAGGKPLPGLVRRRQAEGRLFSQGKYALALL